MTSLPAWAVDPAWPAVPACADEEDAHAPGGAPFDPPHQAELFEHERAAMAARVAELHVQGLRLQLHLHHAQRALLEHPRAPLGAPARAREDGAAPRRRGRPTPTARNDRLLALFEQTSPQAAHLQRCRLAARRFASEVAAAAGLPPEAARVLPVTTARDAIAEARRRRAAG